MNIYFNPQSKKTQYSTPSFQAKNIKSTPAQIAIRYIKRIAVPTAGALAVAPVLDTFERRDYSNEEIESYNKGKEAISKYLQSTFCSDSDRPAIKKIEETITPENIRIAATLIKEIERIKNETFKWEYFAHEEQDYFDLEALAETLELVKAPHKQALCCTLINNDFFTYQHGKIYDIRGLSQILKSYNEKNFQYAVDLSNEGTLKYTYEFIEAAPHLNERIWNLFIDPKKALGFYSFNFNKKELPLVNTVLEKTNVKDSQFQAVLMFIKNLTSQNKLYSHYKLKTSPEKIDYKEFEKFASPEVFPPFEIPSRFTPELEKIQAEIANFLKNPNAPTPKITADEYYSILAINDAMVRVVLKGSNSLQDKQITYEEASRLTEDALAQDEFDLKTLLHKYAEAKGLKYGDNKEFNDFVKEIHDIIDDENRSIKPYNLVPFIKKATPENLPLAKLIYSEDKRELEDVLKIPFRERNFPISIAMDLCQNNDIELDDGPLVLFLERLSVNNCEDMEKAYFDTKSVLKNVRKNPSLYISGVNGSIDAMFCDVSFLIKLVIFADVYKNKLDIDNLLRKRFTNAKNLLDKMLSISTGELRTILKCKKPDGSDFSSSERIEFITFLDRFFNTMWLKQKRELKQAEEARILDIKHFEKMLFFEILNDLGYTDEELATVPEEKLRSWDLDYAYKLSENIESNDNETAMHDIIKASLFENFKEFIMNPSNDYGKINNEVKDVFKGAKLNHDLWLNTDPNDAVIYQQVNFALKKRQELTSELVAQINKLRQTPAGNYVEKVLRDYMDGDNFTYPERILHSNQNLINFTNDILQRLERVWAQAERNQNSNLPEIVKRAKYTLSIQDKLKGIASAAEFIEAKDSKSMTLKIKMWDRFPQKDLFQGDYSDCCIKTDGVNNDAIADYLLNTTFNMIEIIDTESNKVIGNALCYFALNKISKKPVLILDNIELLKAYRTNPEQEIQLRTAIAEFAKNFAKKVAKGKNIDVYLGNRYNDIHTDDLKDTVSLFVPIGKFSTRAMYLDAYEGWTNGNVDWNITLHKISR